MACIWIHVLNEYKSQFQSSTRVFFSQSSSVSSKKFHNKHWTIISRALYVKYISEIAWFYIVKWSVNKITTLQCTAIVGSVVCFCNLYHRHCHHRKNANVNCSLMRKSQNYKPNFISCVYFFFAVFNQKYSNVEMILQKRNLNQFWKKCAHIFITNVNIPIRLMRALILSK